MPEHLNEEGLARLRSELDALTGNRAQRFAHSAAIPDINVADGDAAVLPRDTNNPLEQADRLREDDGQQKKPQPPHPRSESQVPGSKAADIAPISPGMPDATPGSKTLDTAMPIREPGRGRGDSASSGKGPKPQDKKGRGKGKKTKKTTKLRESATPLSAAESAWLDKVEARIAGIDRARKTRPQSLKDAIAATGSPSVPAEAPRGGTPEAGTRGHLPAPHRLSAIKQLRLQPSTPAHASASAAPTPPQQHYLPLNGPAPVREPGNYRAGGWRTASTATTVSDSGSSGSGNSLTIWRRW